MASTLTRLHNCLDTLSLEHVWELDFISISDGTYEVVVCDDPDVESRLVCGLYEGKFELFEEVELTYGDTVADALKFILNKLSV